ncbi:hypothetical protein ABZ885_41955, partial [Kitasatospora sp. NPDC047058]
MLWALEVRTAWLGPPFAELIVEVGAELHDRLTVDAVESGFVLAVGEPPATSAVLEVAGRRLARLVLVSFPRWAGGGDYLVRAGVGGSTATGSVVAWSASLTAGERAGYRKGLEAARALDVFGKRPCTWRNHAWEGDHVQAPLRFVADGQLVRPYVTWFIDCATRAITGVAVTPGCPSRASILIALRSAVLRTGPYGPTGGRPETVRIDRGKAIAGLGVDEHGRVAVPALECEVVWMPRLP